MATRKKLTSEAVPLASEEDLWKPLQPLALAAILFWQSFMQLKRAGKQPLTATDIDHLTRILRAMSWVESKHGSGTGNQPARDPIQCGNPDDAWWPQLAGLGTVFDRYVGGPGAGNYDANQLPAAAADAGLPVLARLVSLADPKKGHRDTSFNPTMSFYWGLPHLIWKTNKTAGRQFYLFDTVGRLELLNGADAYNGNGDPAYRDKIDKALGDAGWPTTRFELDFEQASLVPGVLRQALDAVQEHSGPGKLFPRGISRFHLAMSPGQEGFSVEIDAVPPQDLRSTKDDVTVDVPFELVLQPLSILTPASPTEGSKQDQARLAAGKTIEGAAKLFEKACLGKVSSYANNCAHYLSNAFINSAFADLSNANTCITHRCGSPECSSGGKRPTRAKDMKCWFATKDSTPQSSVSKGTGFYAVYQERPSDGQGHVVILDSNTWKFYGTGWYEAGQASELWTHKYYQW